MFNGDRASVWEMSESQRWVRWWLHQRDRLEATELCAQSGDTGTSQVTRASHKAKQNGMRGPERRCPAVSRNRRAGKGLVLPGSDPPGREGECLVRAAGSPPSTARARETGMEGLCAQALWPLGRWGAWWEVPRPSGKRGARGSPQRGSSSSASVLGLREGPRLSYVSWVPGSRELHVGPGARRLRVQGLAPCPCHGGTFPAPPIAPPPE